MIEQKLDCQGEEYHCYLLMASEAKMKGEDVENLRKEVEMALTKERALKKDPNEAQKESRERVPGAIAVLKEDRLLSWWKNRTEEG